MLSKTTLPHCIFTLCIFHSVESICEFLKYQATQASVSLDLLAGEMLASRLLSLLSSSCDPLLTFEQLVCIVYICKLFLKYKNLKSKGLIMAIRTRIKLIFVSISPLSVRTDPCSFEIQ